MNTNNLFSAIQIALSGMVIGAMIETDQLLLTYKVIGICLCAAMVILRTLILAGIIDEYKKPKEDIK